VISGHRNDPLPFYVVHITTSLLPGMKGRSEMQEDKHTQC
jgi:hypothetical protein